MFIIIMTDSNGANYNYHDIYGDDDSDGGDDTCHDCHGDAAAASHDDDSDSCDDICHNFDGASAAVDWEIVTLTMMIQHSHILLHTDMK